MESVRRQENWLSRERGAGRERQCAPAIQLCQATELFGPGLCNPPFLALAGGQATRLAHGFLRKTRRALAAGGELHE